MRRTIFFSMACLACLALVGNAQERERAATAGKIKAIDKDSITLEGRGETPEQKFKLGADVKVTAGREEAKFADAKVGTIVNLQLSADKKTATHIVLQRGREGAGEAPAGRTGTGGKVKAIDAKTITVELRRREGQPAAEEKFNLAADVKVFEGRRNAKEIGDVKAGTMVTLALTEDKKAVTTIYIFMEAKEGPARENGAAGKVKAVDAKSITLEVRARVATEQKYELAKDVKVQAGRQEKALSDVTAGTIVSVTLNADKKVTAINLQRREKE